MEKIKEIKVKKGTEEVVVPAAISQIYYNDKNNLEISNNTDTDEAGSKINIVAKGAIQLKPGVTKKGKSAAIALDSENDTVNPTEVLVQVTNGADGEYKDKTMRLKLQAAEVVLDTKDAYTGDYDPAEIHIKARCDNKENPVYVKQHARAFDFRCHNHGGIALQIAGKDSSGHENKIKFESDRTNGIEFPYTYSGTYSGEGGKGLEFATFNNVHTSIFTYDYRFNKDGNIYAVTRGVPAETENGKIDYPTQTDDFKDIITGDTPKTTWEELVKTINTLNQQVGSNISVVSVLKNLIKWAQEQGFQLIDFSM